MLQRIDATKVSASYVIKSGATKEKKKKECTALVTIKGNSETVFRD